MSTGNPSPLSFLCPQCQKKLRAPSKLAGQRLACPQCKNTIVVPGAQPKPSDDEEWLNLDSGPADISGQKTVAPPAASARTSPSQPDASARENAASARDDAAATPSRPSLFDDDLPELAPLVESALQTNPNGVPSPPGRAAPKPPSNGAPPSTTKRPSPTLDEFDDDFQLSPIEPAKPKGLPIGLELPTGAPALAGVLDDIVLSSSALDIGSDSVREDEFSFGCKVCGTRMMAPKSRIGKSVRCPDCFSEFLVPEPKVPKKQRTVVLDHEIADVKFVRSDANSVRDSNTSKARTDEMMEKARAEVDAEAKELEGLTASFDSQRWISLLFWFCRDPLLVFIMIFFGLFCAIWFPMVTAAPELFQATERLGVILQAVIFLVPCVPVFGSLLALGMCVLSTVANQYHRIQDWPFTRTGEMAGEVIMVLSSLAIASIPGGMIGTGLASIAGSHITTALFGLLSTWLLFPFFLLSMADNNAITEPFSKNVLDSFKAKPDAWGAMYLQTMLAFGFLFILNAWALRDGIVGEIAIGLFMPFTVLFVFNQYGLLAGRISDITGLGFTGDFSSEEAD
ncbi:hypothetical protein SH467x_004185 [Pirellulaceae bacterium SH467]